MGRAFNHAIAVAPIDALAANALQINGMFEVFQDNPTFIPVSIPALTGTSQGKYICDQWIAGYRGTFTAQTQIVDQRSYAANTFSGTNNMLTVQMTVAQASLLANDSLNITQAIEGYRIGRLNWGYAPALPIACGFLFWSALGGTYGGSIRNGALNRSYPFSFTVPAGTVVFVKVYVPGDVTGTWTFGSLVGLYFTICLAGGSSQVGTPNAWTAGNLVGATGQSNGVATGNVFYIGNVIILPGNDLPPVERIPYIARTYDQELLLCKRYFETGVEPLWYSNLANGLVSAYGDMKFQIQKRIAPTMFLVGWQYYNAGANAAFTPVVNANQDRFTWQGTGLTNWQGWSGSGTWSADARL